MTRLLWMVAMMLLLPWVAQAQQNNGEYMEWLTTSGGVNWSRAQVMAIGVGVPPDGVRYQAKRNALACLAAKVVAQKNLLEMSKGVRIDSVTLVRDAMVESAEIRSTVSGLVKGARIVRRELQEDGSCEVEMMIPIEGSMASGVYHQRVTTSRIDWHSHTLAQWLQQGAQHLSTWQWITQAHATAITPQWQNEAKRINLRLDRIEQWLGSHRQQVADGVAAGDPTGLIIDARGSNFIPSMSPQLLELRGGVIYPTGKTIKQARDHGQLVSLFMRDLMMAQKHPRVGERPLVIKALRTYGKTRTSLVLGKTSSAKLRDLIKKGIMNHAGVIVVLN